ncbi:FIST N-terminal domain-containing protein, partial [Flavobacterium sp.]|uniref:FIST N-terminal domain-containing protein n=1 Tax=Flavobacterium sp. TaxID=239 RepID=UPI00344DD86B|nr:histidine kinase [Flavobacterium sp.]
MRINQAYKLKGQNWKYLTEKIKLQNPLVLIFGNRMLLEQEETIAAIKTEFPYSHLVFGSTAGEIIDANVFDDSVVVTAIDFDKSSFVVKTANTFDYNKDANALGVALYNKMPK